MTKWMMMATILGTNFLGACLEDGTPTSNDPTSETEQQVLDQGQTALQSCSSSRGCSFSLGATHFGKVCYILGLKGDLRGATVSIDLNDSGTDFLQIVPGSGRTVSASALCTDIDGSASGGGTWVSGTAAVSLNVGAGSQCAITRISNPSGFQNVNDQLRVAQDGDGNWTLGGNMVSGHITAASATCWTPGTPAGSFNWQAFSGTATKFFSPVRSGMICAPTLFQGNFTSASSEVSVGINAGLAEQFLTVSNTEGTATCSF